MVITTSISWNERTYNNYLKDYTSNRSRFVEDHFLIGLESAAEDPQKHKSEKLVIYKENRELKDQLAKLKAELGRKESEIKRMKEKKKEVEHDDELLKFRTIKAR